jgi:hypothetical protein
MYNTESMIKTSETYQLFVVFNTAMKPGAICLPGVTRYDWPNPARTRVPAALDTQKTRPPTRSVFKYSENTLKSMNFDSRFCMVLIP